ncbi:MAG: hypothetical protein E5X14_14355 [Mesorhizobium sp.]|nr:MAG: hypothetical protein E5X96_00500 [Mesorhizobium sp.]TIS07134.1 MAG: hypothetical protein E5X14_14355 [Mesorhizobium sp.]TIS13555.1 MAG: hypothetical protein E5X10_15115 [Mesorhizobium sp.]
MPDAFSAKQYLEPDDMAMLERVLQKLLPASADAAEREWLGSLLIAAFQNGVTGRGGADCHDG